MASRTKRLFGIAAGLVLTAAALPANAIPFTFSNEFSGSGDTCANVTCATLDVVQNGANLDFMLTANLAAGEFITGLYGNLDPFSAITGTILGGTGVDSYASSPLQQDGLKADGDGYFDWLINFRTSPPRFDGTDTFSFRFFSVDISRVVDAISVNGPAGKNGFTFALRVQGLGADNNGSGWFNSTTTTTQVPEPPMLGLFGLALLAIGLVRRRQNRLAR